MLGNLSFSLSVVANSFQMMRRHPLLLVPILIIWIYCASLTIYFEFFFDSDLYSLKEVYLIAFLAIFGTCFFFATGASLMLEFIQHEEEGDNLSLGRAIKDTFFHNLPKMLPVIFFWAVIVFIITVIQAIFSRDKDEDGGDSDGGDRAFNARNTAETLSGADTPFSWIKLGLGLLKKAVRMAVFMILPAIAWEEKGPWSGFKRGLSVVKNHAGKFVTGFMMTELIGLTIFLPVAIIFEVEDIFEITFPDMFWFGVIFYMAIAFSYYIFLEILFCAELYLWNLRWELAVSDALANGKKPPESMDDVARPRLLSNISSPKKTSYIDAAKNEELGGIEFKDND